MFNSYAYRQQNSVRINAVSGMILKNHPKSWFKKFGLNSVVASDLLTEGGHQAHKRELYDGGGRYSDNIYISKRDPDNDIIVLQMMLCGENEVIAECVYRKDFEDRVDEEHHEAE